MPPMAFTGLVTKVGCMNKTATVTVSRFVLHPRVGKRLEKTKKYLTHDENNRLTAVPYPELRHGDLVLIRNCPPISARKRFALERIIQSPEREREKAHSMQGIKSEAARTPEPTPTAETQSRPEASL
ncbi:uncharacterized protein B0H18DRAFT_961574 [Fomitopsis serialis]|uniref:uncharacterized protein n=1 Tax=Fomitopsis serialis TaxID=139415 RepID=UPI002007DFFA|nr:uncharacterized protein B0H18DRAFT_961574 [Neoantrodia serialis]KAH9911855.1 hypothetical protein B0H18DRAFT_961574 [Neoantrodia serialis]